MIEFLHVYKFDLTHSECNMALFFFSLGMCIVFSCHKFWCFRFFYEHAFFKMNLKSNLLINFE